MQKNTDEKNISVPQYQCPKKINSGYLGTTLMLFLILLFSTWLLLIIVLIWAFVSFAKLVKLEHRDFPAEWDKDGQPFGIYVNQAKTRSHFRSGTAGLWLMFLWLFQSPKWIRLSEQASMLLWQYRVLVLIWNIGLILWFLIVMFTRISPV